jgi:hypothetical protein
MGKKLSPQKRSGSALAPPHHLDLSRLRIESLTSRVHDLTLEIVRKPTPIPAEDIPPSFLEVARRMVRARAQGAAVLFMLGAHVLRAGMQAYLIDLLERKYLSGVAGNGAVVIHDFELALIGATTESVSRYIAEGQFGLWRETGRINDIVNAAWRDDPRAGYAGAVGRALAEGDYPHKASSLLAACHRLGTPVTAHVGIGYDIIHEHPNFDGAATGALSHNDFLTFAGLVERLEGGVVMNFGSAVMAPEVFLKALAMARNLARQEDREICRFATLVCDLRQLPADLSHEPAKDDPSYYFRPLKTMLLRTVRDGGESFFVRGHHAHTIPALWTALGLVETGEA